MKVVVTGGAGFIGVHTVRRLVEEGAEVLVIDDLRHPCGEKLPDSVEMVVADIANAADTVARFKPDAMLHLAAQGGVSRSVRDPAGDAQINVVGTVALLKACSLAACRRFVFASSGGAIYGHARKLPSPETTKPQPLSPYGAAKLAAEGYLGMFGRTFGLSTVALRYGNVYGPYQDGTGEAGVVAISSERLLRGEPPQIRGDGEQTRDFVYVGDVAAANLLALRKKVEGPINIGTGVQTNVLQIVNRLIELAHYPQPASFVDGRPGEVRASALDIRRAARLLGWEPQTSLHEGLAETFRSFQQRAQGSEPASTRGRAGGATTPGPGRREGSE